MSHETRGPNVLLKLLIINDNYNNWNNLLMGS